MTTPRVHERTAGETPTPPARSRHGAFVIPSPTLLLFQLVAGSLLVVIITLAARPLLGDGPAIRALGMGTMFVAGFVDWRRWREIQWRPFAAWAVFIYALAFAVWYLFPD
jgi:hypothetical protein